MGRLRIKKIIGEIGNLFEFRSFYRPYLFLLILILLYLVPLSFLESLPNVSLCSKLYGSRCYSVGLTRGLSALIKGDLSLALEYNFLSILVLIIIVIIIFKDLIDRKSV